MDANKFVSNSDDDVIGAMLVEEGTEIVHDIGEGDFVLTHQAERLIKNLNLDPLDAIHVPRIIRNLLTNNGYDNPHKIPEEIKIMQTTPNNLFPLRVEHDTHIVIEAVVKNTKQGLEEVIIDTVYRA